MTHHAQTDSSWSKITAAYNRWPGIGLVLIVAAVLRLGSILLLRTFLHPEAWEFGDIARRISAGLGYTIQLSNGSTAPSAFMPPAYPYLLAFFFKLGGQRPITYLSIELIQAALGVLLVYLVYRIAAILLGEKGAIVAASLAAIYPTQIYMCNEYHSISIYIVLGGAAVFFLIQYLEVSHSWRDVTAAGLCMGLQLLFRSEAVALLLLYAVILVVRGGWKSARQAIVFSLIALAFLAPWSYRNYHVFGRLVLVTTTNGMNLWIGHNPHAKGSNRASWAAGIPNDLQKELDRVPLDREFEIETDNVFKKTALGFIRAHPRAEAELALRKLFVFFAFDPAHQKGRQPAYWLPSILLTLLALYGAALRGKKLLGEDLLLVASVFFAVALGIAVFVLPRYKIVTDPFLMIFAANGLLHGAQRKRQSASG